MKKSGLFGLIAVAGIIASPFVPKAVSSFNHRNDHAYVDVCSHERMIICGPGHERGQKEMTLKFGTPFEYHFSAGEYQGIRQTRVYINNSLYYEDTDTSNRGVFPNNIGGVGHFSRENVLENFHVGENVVRYEVEDILGNINADSVNIRMVEVEESAQK